MWQRLSDCFWVSFSVKWDAAANFEDDWHSMRSPLNKVPSFRLSSLRRNTINSTHDRYAVVRGLPWAAGPSLTVRVRAARRSTYSRVRPAVDRLLLICGGSAATHTTHTICGSSKQQHLLSRRSNELLATSRRLTTGQFQSRSIYFFPHALDLC